MPGCADAVQTLEEVERLARQSSDRIPAPTLLLLAERYARLSVQLITAFDQLPEEEQRSGRELTARLAAAEGERRRLDRAAERRQSVAESEAERKQSVAESVAARRRLGQRTSASELSAADVQRALYGDPRGKSLFEQLLEQLRESR